VNFYPGQIVICVRGYGKYLIAGNKYIVKDYGEPGTRKPTGSMSSENGHGWVSIYSVPNEVPELPWANLWRASRFRPLDDSDLEAIREKYKDEVPTAPKLNVLGKHFYQIGRWK
jgi:hypothetical protein